MPDKQTKIAAAALTVTIIGIIVAVILFFKGEESDDIRAQPYSFKVQPNILKPEDKIFIIANNEKTNRKSKRANGKNSLDVKFDDRIFYNAGRPAGRTRQSMQKWVFQLKKYKSKAKPSMFDPGEHSICFAFSGEKFSDVQYITFKSSGNWTIIIIIILLMAVIAAFVLKRLRKKSI